MENLDSIKFFHPQKPNTVYQYIYIESRKMMLINLFVNRCSVTNHRDRMGWERGRESHSGGRGHMPVTDSC